MLRKLKMPSALLLSIPAELLDACGHGPMIAEAINAAPLAFMKAVIECLLGGLNLFFWGRATLATQPSLLEQLVSSMV
ncbi:hypothetical protein [Alcaligenes faecalis]|uniref:hypothetical protein n=1 Tax=Alcaligenes faecalis TaxID=511 RepID=UPI000F0B3C66|nr:hypothetical protein [Alcaligenes faecalis]AYR20419.1 hypothetical protein D6I95_08675 [Alcaligenes faecalis]